MGGAGRPAGEAISFDGIFVSVDNAESGDFFRCCNSRKGDVVTIGEEALGFVDENT